MRSRFLSELASAGLPVGAGRLIWSPMLSCPRFPNPPSVTCGSWSAGTAARLVVSSRDHRPIPNQTGPGLDGFRGVAVNSGLAVAPFRSASGSAVWSPTWGGTPTSRAEVAY
jgi:hypothetical protein